MEDEWKAGPPGLEPGASGSAGRRPRGLARLITRVTPGTSLKGLTPTTKNMLGNTMRLIIYGNEVRLRFRSPKQAEKFADAFIEAGVTDNVEKDESDEIKEEIKIVIDDGLWKYMIKDRLLDERTAKDYLNYLKKLKGEVLNSDLYERIASSTWSVKAVRVYIHYLYKAKRIDREKRNELLEDFKIKQDRSIKYRNEKAQTVVSVFRSKKLRPHEELLFKILLYSGVRFSEAFKLINEFDEDQLECNDEFCRYPLFWTRGRKRCDYVYLPRYLVDDLKKYKGAFAGRNVRTVGRKLEKKFSVKLKLFRKLFYQTCRDIASGEICDFFQSRVSRLTIGDRHYDNLVERGDRYYPSVMKKIKEVVTKVLDSLSQQEEGSAGRKEG